jgi:hypothetical protein
MAGSKDPAVFVLAKGRMMPAGLLDLSDNSSYRIAVEH